LRLSPASVAAACLIGAACGGADLVLPDDDTIPAAIEAIRGNEQVAPPGAELPAPIVVSVTDEEGRPLGGVRVAFEPGAGSEGGTTSPDTAMTGANGEASARWVLGRAAGDQRVSAEVVDAGLDMVSFTATAVATAPSPSAERSSVAASPASIEAVTGLSVITVTVRDGAGEPVRGATVTLAASGAGNTLIQPTAPTDADGVAQGTLQAIVPGPRVVSAVVNGSLDIQETATVSVVLEPEPDRLAFIVQPTDTEEDDPIAPAVAVAIVDGNGDVIPLSGVEIRLELIREQGHDSGELEGTTEQVTTAGVAIFPDLEVDRDDDSYRLRAMAPDRPELGSVDSETFDVED
jgi:hypothetical protein